MPCRSFGGMETPTTLTIEHLAACLPYDVGAKWNKYPRKRFKLQGVLYGKPWLIDSSSCTEKAQIHDIKLILRPLSQLTVPIIHNGETFEPLVRLNHVTMINGKLQLRGEVEGFHPDPVFEDYRFLHSLHFDTFGLIEAGLAVAMNPDGSLAQ